MTELLVEALASYDRALGDGDTSAVTELVTALLAAGHEPVTVLTEVVAAAQRAVGVRWQRGEWTVAQEHAATAMAVSATRTVRAHADAIPVSRGGVIVACAEREWHALPAMIIECALRVHGFDTVLLGASTTPSRLNQHLLDHGPEAVAVSCSVLGALPTTRRFIEASTAAGVPIAVGGPAFGSDDSRARALGATAWAPDARSAVEVVAGLPAVVSPAARIPAAAATEVAALELDHRRLVASMQQRWSLLAQYASSGDDALRAALEVSGDVLHQALHAVTAAVLTGDSRTVTDTAWWIGDLLATRGVGASAVAELGQLLSATLRDFPLARGLVEEFFVVSDGAGAATDR